jgi:two-component system, OmpR family, phosphate regulon sensor histidine kinase PhoR
LQTFFIALLALIAAFLAWRHIALLRGVRSLHHLICTETAPKSVTIAENSDSHSLARLSRAICDLVAESTLSRDLERSRRSLLESLLDEIDDALLIVDEHSEVRFANQSARRIFPSDLPPIGRPLIEVCFDHRVIETVDLAWQIGAKTQEHFTRRVQFPADGRAERSYLVEAEPLTGLGIGTGAWVLIRDVTLTLEIERIRQDFVANASHELRTPLSILTGYLEMLDDTRSVNAATLRRCVPTMRKHADRLARIVEDMLTISKLESHEDLLSHEPFDLADSIRDSLDHLQPLIDQQHARIHLDLPVQAPIVGDRLYWGQIFFNLIENALKQNPDPGLNLTIRLTPGQGRYQIEIIDDGIGIPAADLPHIFKRFYRVQKDHAQTVKGTGLGLSIVKRAVEAHHGTIKVRSQPGRETAFIIEVPQPTAPRLLESGSNSASSSNQPAA